MFEVICYIILGVVILGILYRILNLVEFILIPINNFVSKIVGVILWPLKSLWNLCKKGFNALKNKIFRNNRELLPWLGGINLFVWIIFCLIFSVFTFAYITLNSKHGFQTANEQLLMSFPVFSLFNLIFISSNFTPYAIFDLCIFSILAVAFMGNTKKLNIFIQTVYDLIFTIFCTSLIYWIPDKLYDIPLNFFAKLPQIYDYLTNIGIIAFIPMLIFFIIVGYLIVVAYSLAIKELVSTVAFSLFPFALMATIILILESFNMPKNIFNILGYLITLVLSIVLIRMRLKAENEHDN